VNGIQFVADITTGLYDKRQYLFLKATIQGVFIFKCQYFSWESDGQRLFSLSESQRFSMILEIRSVSYEQLANIIPAEASINTFALKKPRSNQGFGRRILRDSMAMEGSLGRTLAPCPTRNVPPLSNVRSIESAIAIHIFPATQ
jgi:hypothetical protein